MQDNITNEFLVTSDNSKKRIDTYLRGLLHNKYSRNYIQHAIKQNKVLVNGKPVTANYRTKEADRITIDIPPRKEYKALPEKIPVDIIYEDDDLIIINKPAGMVVHPAFGNFTGTLVNALLYHYPDLPEPVRKNKEYPLDNSRLGIVHRLDKNTSGLIIVTKNQASMTKVAAQFEKRIVKKTYLAVVEGKTAKKGNINAPIGRSSYDRKKMTVNLIAGKASETSFKLVKYVGPCSLIEVYPKTGRMHQIRVHMAHIGFPIIGDKDYWKGILGVNIPRQMLHAHKITFIHPSTGKEVTFTSGLPADMKKVLIGLGRIKTGCIPAFVNPQAASFR
jgi:23S rRNA pseudouridine1911/1915/1917 synthase